MRVDRPRLQRVGRALVAAILLPVVLPVVARAYNLNPSQWLEGPIKLILALGPADHPLQDGSTSWDAVAEHAVADWNGNLGLVKFAFTVDDDARQAAGDKKNTVAFSATVDGDEFGDEAIAVTLIRYDSATGYINEADVLVNNHYTYDSYAGPLQGSGPTQNFDLHRILLHEFGHVLGLLHPDDIGQNVSAVMNSVVSDTDHLTADDTNGTTTIYGDPALTSVNVLANGLTVENGRGLIYVSEAKASGKGRLEAVDPYLGKIIASVRTGPQPGALTESGGGEHLYLGIDGRGAIDQIDPDTLATTQEFALGTQPGVTAASIEVLHGAPESLLVSQAGNQAGALQHNVLAPCADFAVYDGGVPRPEELFDTNDTPGTPIILEDGDQTFYAFLRTFHDLGPGVVSRLTLDAGGVSSQVQAGFLDTGNLAGGADFDQGILYGSDGSVANLDQGSYETPFGDVRRAGGASVVAGDGDLGQAYFVVPRADTSAEQHMPTLLVEDIATRARLGNIALPRYTSVYRLNRWGANGLLFAVSGGRVLFIRSNLLAPGPVAGPPVLVTLGAPNHASIDEGGARKSRLTVARANDDLSMPLTVRYTVSGTAENGTDYRALSGVVTIPAGQATAKIKVVPAGSHFSDGPRTLQIRLTPELPYRWGASTTALVTFTDGGG